jgi:hypothetical protein
MKRPITTYPDQEFSIGPGKCLRRREKYEDKTERLCTVSCCSGTITCTQRSRGFVFIRGTIVTQILQDFPHRLIRQLSVEPVPVRDAWGLG